MALKYTTKSFCERVNEVHNGYYDLSLVSYTGIKNKIQIGCPKHGLFLITADSFLRGCGCAECGVDKLREFHLKKEEDYINECKAIHGNKYIIDENFNYSGTEHDVYPICPIHGRFRINANNFLHGHGCIKCYHERQTIERKGDLETFIEKAQQKHGDKYDYSKAVYVNAKTNLTVICSTHGEFEVTPNNHLKGSGCPYCAGRYKTNDDLIKKFRLVHGDTYDYSKVDKDNKDEKGRVCIICKEHGEFWQTPANHLKGKGCKKCAQKKIAKEFALTQNEFIQRTRAIHRDKYIYTNSQYVNANTPVEIICPKHGSFFSRPSDHIRGGGCEKCYHESQKLTIIEKQQHFRDRVKKKFGDLYDTTNTVYVDDKTKCTIICPTHGEVEINPTAFLQSEIGCPKCSHELGGKKKTETCLNTNLQILERQFGDEYDFTGSYISGLTGNYRASFYCSKHGNVRRNIHDMLNGAKCLLCERGDEFIKHSIAKFGDNFDYSQIVYEDCDTEVTLICKEHGEFKITPTNHLNSKYGCPKCADKAVGDRQKISGEEFIRRAKEVHGEQYIYYPEEYVNYNTPLPIKCLIHGIFPKRPGDHLRGQGCPYCSNGNKSKAEISIFEYVKQILPEDEVISGNKKILNGLEMDVYVPSMKIGIEFDGLHWHSEEQGKDRNYHLNKTLLAKENGIHLIHIFEDEWVEHEDLVKDKICHMLHKDSNKIKIGARKCQLRQISVLLAKPFLEKYHIQGWASSSIYCGAFYEGKLVGVMSFLQESQSMWNLTRFSTDINYAIPGLANKLFKFFVNEYSNDIIEVKTFLDRRWSWADINVYDRMGFDMVKIVRPNYHYVKHQQRFHKFGFRKQTLAKKYNLPLTMTETEMTKKIGMERIWDCGLFKYVWKNSQQNS